MCGGKLRRTTPQHLSLGSRRGERANIAWTGGRGLVARAHQQPIGDDRHQMLPLQVGDGYLAPRIGRAVNDSLGEEGVGYSPVADARASGSNAGARGFSLRSVVETAPCAQSAWASFLRQPSGRRRPLISRRASVGKCPTRSGGQPGSLAPPAIGDDTPVPGPRPPEG
jgi:hypothetical protein